MMFVQRSQFVRAGCAAIFYFLLANTALADDQGNFEVHEWSVWAVAPNESDFNGSDKYPSAMPTFANTPRLPSAGRGEDVIAPVSLLTFRGQPTKDVDVGVRAQIGRFISHWPKANQTEKRVRWQGLELVKELSESARLAYASDDHWFTKARKLDNLYARVGAREERFLAYDAVIHSTIPMEIAGGPDTFQVSNTGKFPVYDVLLSAPSPEGRRIGWLDVLPAAKVEEAAPEKPVDLASTKTLPAQGGAVHALAFVPGGTRLASANDDGMIRLWDTASGQLQMTLSGQKGPVRAMAFINENRLLSGGDDKKLHVWDVATGKSEKTVEKHEAAITALVVASGSAQALSGDKEGRGYRWNTGNSEPTRKPIPLHRGAVLSAAITPDENFVVTAGDDKTAKIWKPRATPSPVAGTLKGHHDHVTAVTCAADNATAATGSLDATVRIWKLSDRTEQAKLEIGGRIRGLAYIPGTSRLVVGTEEPDKLSIWDATTKRQVARLTGQISPVSTLAIGSDGRTLAVSGTDGSITIWDISQEAFSAAGGKTPLGPSIDLVLNGPKPAGSPDLRADTRESLSKRLVKAGLDEAETNLILSTYGKAIFESKELIALCRLAPDAIEEMMPVDIFPEPKKFTRVALVLVRKIDPRSKAEIADLVKQLGDSSYERREAAEKRLAELGSVAIPALRAASRDNDLEIVFRAERLLAGQGQASK